MATYNSTFVNIATGETDVVMLTDDDVRNGVIPYRVLITSDKAQITGDGVDTATITLQIVTAPLASDTQENVPLATTLDVTIGDEIYSVTTDNTGAESIALTSVDNATALTISTAPYTSNELTVGVV